MSSVPVLTQSMILLICLTILPTITKGQDNRLDPLRLYILNVIDDDKCNLIGHDAQAVKECQGALDRFQELPSYEKAGCPFAKEADCRYIDKTFVCSFVCRPRRHEYQAVLGTDVVLHDRIVSLREVTIPMRSYLEKRIARELPEFQRRLRICQGENEGLCERLMNLSQRNQLAFMVLQQQRQQHAERMGQRDQDQQMDQQLEQFLREIEDEGPSNRAGGWQRR